MPAWKRRATEPMTSSTGTVRRVGAEIEVEVTESTTLDFQVAVSRQPGLTVDESLIIKLNGKTVEPREIVGEHQTRIHVVQAGKGTVSASYSAAVTTAVRAGMRSPTSSLALPPPSFSSTAAR